MIRKRRQMIFIVSWACLLMCSWYFLQSNLQNNRRNVVKDIQNINTDDKLDHLAINKNTTSTGMDAYAEVKRQMIVEDVTKPVAEIVTRTSVHQKRTLVVYNRVPKCASSLMIWMTSKLARQNKYTVMSDNWPGLKQHLNETEQIELKKNISRNLAKDDLMFIRHLDFIDMNEWFPDVDIVYINIIRHPVDRLISHFNYMRHGFEQNTKKWEHKIKINTSLEHCIKTNPKCVRQNAKSMLLYFCGHHKVCSTYVRAVQLKMAIKNVNKYYSVVGITEDLENSLLLLEKTYPRFFRNASNLLKQSEFISAKTKGVKDGNLSVGVMNILSKSLKEEIKFYEYIKHRIETQLKNIL